jgi:uncharacterized protein
MPFRFRWDPSKDAVNRRKHGVSLDEARTVFADSPARIFPDEDHSEVEDRELIIGRSNVGRLLIVSFIERPDGIRIISARPPTRQERHDYEEKARP